VRLKKKLYLQKIVQLETLKEYSMSLGQIICFRSLHRLIMRISIVLLFVISLVIAQETNSIPETSPPTQNTIFDEGSPEIEQTEKNSNFECEGPWRLQRNILPTHYDVSV